MSKTRITFKNFWLWFQDQVLNKNVIKHFLITKNGFGGLSIYSHIRKSTGQPKLCYKSLEIAKSKAEWMHNRYGKYFSYYKCLFCDGYHIGKGTENGNNR